MELHGIDVSSWQGKIDWSAVRGNADFAMIRMGCGSKNGIDLDRRFYENVAGALGAGIPAGAYVYSYAKTAAQAEAEALGCLAVLENLKKTFLFPIAFDMEQYRLGRELMTDICAAFLSRIEEAGWYAAIYSSTAFFRDELDDSRLARYDHWVAQWHPRCTYPGEYGIWQNGCSGKIPGIGTDTDTDVAYKNYPAVIVSSSLNGFTAGDVDGDGELTAQDARRAL
nr:glycoside hydrolase family 25 protein [Clostridiales bacterium]